MRLVPTLQHAMTLEMCRLRMGQLAYEEGDYAQARGFLDASLTYFKSGASLQTMQETWEKGQIAEAVTILGDVERAEGHHEAAWRNLHEALSIVMPMPQLQPELLTVLAGTADLLAAQSKYEQAAELAAFVRDNPKAYAVDRTRAARLLDKLCAEMPTDTFAEYVERGQSLELEAVAAGLLDEN